jgi:hypothetical protein
MFVTKATPLRDALNTLLDILSLLIHQHGVPQYVKRRSKHIQKLVEDNVTHINQRTAGKRSSNNQHLTGSN